MIRGKIREAVPVVEILGVHANKSANSVFLFIFPLHISLCPPISLCVLRVILTIYADVLNKVGCFAIMADSVRGCLK
jgi:hypothetical protein